MRWQVFISRYSTESHCNWNSHKPHQHNRSGYSRGDFNERAARLQKCDPGHKPGNKAECVSTMKFLGRDPINYSNCNSKNQEDADNSCCSKVHITFHYL